MTELLQKAFAEAAKLPSDEQDALAALLLKEIESEQRWTEAFAKSEGKLAELADEAIAEFRAGKTKPLED
jgi:hypothetical protein